MCGIAPSAVTKAIGVSAPGWESSTIRLHPTGKATVITGTSPHGQGHATSWSQIVESELGIPFDDVEVIHGDTAFAPYGLGTYGSRSLAVGGTALHLSIEKVKDKARKIAAHLLEASEDDLDFEGGRFFVKGSPDRGHTIQEVIGAAWTADNLPAGVEPLAVGAAGEAAAELAAAPVSGVAGLAAAVGVDVSLGAGEAAWVESAFFDEAPFEDPPEHGGIAQSIGQALYEETVYDESGQLLTGTLVDYLVPAATEIPHMDISRTETPSPTNPLGVKGIGEAGTIAATAAVVNSVCDALDVDHLDMPLQPERVWRAIQQAKGGAS